MSENQSIEELRKRLKQAEESQEVVEVVDAEIVPEDEIIPELKALPISAEEREALPFVSNGLIFVVCGESERAFSMSRIVQIIPVDDDLQCVILYDMETEDNRFVTQVVQHRVADIRGALS